MRFSGKIFFIFVLNRIPFSKCDRIMNFKAGATFEKSEMDILGEVVSR